MSRAYSEKPPRQPSSETEHKKTGIPKGIPEEKLL